MRFRPHAGLRLLTAVSLLSQRPAFAQPSPIHVQNWRSPDQGFADQGLADQGFPDTENARFQLHTVSIHWTFTRGGDSYEETVCKSR